MALTASRALDWAANLIDCSTRSWAQRQRDVIFFEAVEMEVLLAAKTATARRADDAVALARLREFLARRQADLQRRARFWNRANAWVVRSLKARFSRRAFRGARAPPEADTF